MGRPAINMESQRFGRLVVVGRAPMRSRGGGIARWICKCDCGTTVNVPGSRLRTNSTKSCGCFRRDRAGEIYRSHGKSSTPEYCMFYDARKRAQSSNLPFEITPLDIVIPIKCPILDVELSLTGPRDSRPSLDRIIPSLGYVSGNVAVISFRANRLKSDASLVEIEAVANYIRSRCAV
jgi:hypothetical protein